MVMKWKNCCFVCNSVSPILMCFLKTSTSHTLRWAAIPGSIREAGALVVSTQNVRVFTEELNHLSTSNCDSSTRFVVAVQQFGWRDAPGSVCLDCTCVCGVREENMREKARRGEERRMDIMDTSTSETVPLMQAGAVPLHVALGRQVLC